MIETTENARDWREVINYLNNFYFCHVYSHFALLNLNFGLFRKVGIGFMESRSSGGIKSNFKHDVPAGLSSIILTTFVTIRPKGTTHLFFVFFFMDYAYLSCLA